MYFSLALAGNACKWALNLSRRLWLAKSRPVCLCVCVCVGGCEAKTLFGSLLRRSRLLALACLLFIAVDPFWIEPVGLRCRRVHLVRVLVLCCAVCCALLPVCSFLAGRPCYCCRLCFA